MTIMGLSRQISIFCQKFKSFVPTKKQKKPTLEAKNQFLRAKRTKIGHRWSEIDFGQKMKSSPLGLKMTKNPRNRRSISDQKMESLLFRTKMTKNGPKWAENARNFTFSTKITKPGPLWQKSIFRKKLYISLFDSIGQN